MITNGSRVTFVAEDGRTYTGTYQGIVQPYEHRHHAIQVDGYSEPNWVRVGSAREETIRPVEDKPSLKFPELDALAEVWNSSTTTPQDIINATDKALRAAGYDLVY